MDLRPCLDSLFSAAVKTASHTSVQTPWTSSRYINKLIQYNGSDNLHCSPARSVQLYLLSGAHMYCHQIYVFGALDRLPALPPRQMALRFTAVFAELTVVTNRQTDHATCNFGIKSRIWLM